jgi:hypothetical protein
MVALCPQGYVELICYPLGSCEAPLEEAHSPLYPRALPQHLDEHPSCSAQRKSWRRWRIPLASCNCRVLSATTQRGRFGASNPPFAVADLQ